MCLKISLEHPDEVVDDEDDDVAEERDRVMSGDAKDDTLVLHELTKVCVTVQTRIILTASFLLWQEMTVTNQFYF